MAEFIYTMIKARKKVGEKVILDDVTMSFYPGAKIGMVGPNGAGKSTILKIMAGLDEPSSEDVQTLIGELQRHGVEIRQKRNLGRLLGQSVH
jgi:ATPase subunit of ABC transporter with duplicated ATPase domains